MEDLCAQAIQIGLGEVAFTEHLDLQPDDPGYGYYNYERYRREVDENRSRFGGDLAIRMAIEITYQHEYDREIREMIENEFDYVLGSVHTVELEFIYLPDYYHKREAEAAYRAYYLELLLAARSGYFNCLGHFDLPKRYSYDIYGPVSWRLFLAEIDDILRAAVESGTGLEINASGLRQQAKETYPGVEIIRRYRELGGEIVTVGSDAHTVGQLGFGIREALEVAEAAGFKHIAVFEGRKPRYVPIIRM